VQSSGLKSNGSGRKGTSPLHDSRRGPRL